MIDGTAPETSTVFWLDSDHRIVEVDQGWDDFAAANEGQACLSRLVRGRQLSTFIQGDVTRMWVETILRLARMRSEPVVRPYRCDGPKERRYMRMSVCREDRRVMRLEHRLEKSEPRSREVRIYSSGNWGVIRRWRCSICGKLEWEGTWMEADVASSMQAGAAVGPGVLLVSYTVCPACQRLMR